MTTIETKRLFIAELAIADAPFIFEITNTAEWLQFIGDRGIRNITDAENYIINGPMTSYAKYNHGLYKLALKDTGAPVGMCGIIKRDTLEDKDLGFALLPQYAGHGYALEAATAVLQYTAQTLGAQRIVAITLPENKRSVQLLGKLGFAFEKMVVLAGGTEELMLMALQQPTK